MSFCLGIGGLFVVWLSAYFGRLPVLVFFSAMALGTSAWCAAATSFDSYMAARILFGFFSSVGQSVSAFQPRHQVFPTNAIAAGRVDVYTGSVFLS